MSTANTTTTQKFWHGDVPTVCQVTDQPITDRFVDGATVYGPWACMSPSGHARYGRGLGTGRGQLYQRQPGGKWLKIDG